MDFEENLKRLRAEYGEAGGGAVRDPKFKKVADTLFDPSGHARRALCRHPDLPRRAAPRRSTGARRISATSRGDRRHPDGSRRHQPQRRALRPARGAHHRADRPLQPRARMRADARSEARRYRRRPVPQPLQPRPVARGHRARDPHDRRGGRGAALGRRRPFDDAADPARRRPGPAGRHGPYRRALRHVRARST